MKNLRPFAPAVFAFLLAKNVGQNVLG